MRRALRWVVATLTTIGAFLLAWGGMALAGMDSDTTFSLAGLAVTVVGGFLFWWAGQQPAAMNPQSRHGLPEPDQPRGQIVVGEIPQRPMAFQARADLHRRLAEAGLATGAGRVTVVQALTGARGVGKTQLAAAYARECIEQGWPVVVWITAEEPGQVLSGLVQLGDALGMRCSDDQAEAVARKVRRWLETQAPQRCLVVFDNATDPEDLRRRLPAISRGQIVITSNDRAFENFGTPVDIGVFTEEEAVALLEERTGLDDETGAKKLAAEIGYLPIALAQSAAVIRRQRLTYPTFLRRLLEIPLQEYLAPGPGDTYPHGSAHAVLLSLDTAERGHGLSRALVDLLAVLSPAGVSRDLLYAAGENSILAEGRVSATEVDEALGVLRETASLIDFSVDGHVVIMHRFTQRVIRDRGRRSGRLTAMVSGAARLLTASLLPDDQAWARRSTGGHLLQQIAALWDAATTCEHFDNALTDEVGLVQTLLGLRRWAVRHLREVADLTSALTLGATALSEHERFLGGDHPDTLLLRDLLATVYQDAERLDEATSLFERNLTDRERIFGPDHPDTIASRQNLACAYQEAGRLTEAIMLYEGVIGDRQRIFGPDHPATLASRNKLACAFRDSGRFDEAIAGYERNLADQSRVLGADHPDTLATRRRLALSYQHSGRLTEAITVFGQALADRERILGPDHPRTLESRNDLACAYQNAGRVDEAITVYEQTLTEGLRALEEGHPLLRTVRENLAQARELRDHRP